MNTNELYTEPTEEHLFTGQDAISLDEASTGQRFLNYLIDALLMQYGLAFATGYLLVQLLLAVSPNTAYELFGDDRSSGNLVIASYLLAIVNYLIYYTIAEKAFRGYTLGKLVTGTRAIREDGGELTWRDAFLRTISRLVPFEPLSIWFGNGLWHDRWTKTLVIKSR
ncbi:MAG: RDD family protein [Bacteroidota bacterium]